ncbi:MAG: hypothetical protein JJT75_04630 [Opitutales bacterium]|nr:hypothetical protein [Opitutales bacterium]MCH8540440.1 hypothetical protein [Opitutales bacterium]
MLSSFSNGVLVFFGSLLLLFLMSGCLRIKSDPIRIDPIHVHVHVTVEQALDDLFLDIDRASRARSVQD